jgi:hypothetical protein
MASAQSPERAVPANAAADANNTGATNSIVLNGQTFYLCPSGSCNFCKGYDLEVSNLERDNCKLFGFLKHCASEYSYVLEGLLPEDAVGFSAASVFFYRHGVNPVTRKPDIYVLMARERREKRGIESDRLNFPGGPRHRLRDAALDVAVRTFDEETGYCLRRSTIRAMRGSMLPSGDAFQKTWGCPFLSSWYAEGKMIMYFFECSPEEAYIDIRAAGVPGAKRLEWVLQSLLQNPLFSADAVSDVHGFAKDQIDLLEEENVFERLYFVTTATGSDCAADSVLERGKAARYMDAFAAVKTIAREARPRKIVRPAAVSLTNL